MPPQLPPLPRAPRQSRLRSRTVNRPVVPRESSDGLARLPPCRVRMPHAARQKSDASSSIRPRRLAAAWRIRADGVHLPMRSAILPHRNCVAPRRRQPQAMAAPPPPDFRRPSGLPVCRSGLRPRRHRTAPKRRQCTAGTKAAPEKSVYQPCRCWPQCRFSAPSLPDFRDDRTSRPHSFDLLLRYRSDGAQLKRMRFRYLYMYSFRRSAGS